MTDEHATANDLVRERRVKAIACTEPLHALQSNRGRRGWEAFDFYELALGAVDAVVDKMGFDTGISPELDATVLRDARRFAPDLADHDLLTVGNELIETLIRPSAVDYTGDDDVRRRFSFALLSEHEDAERNIYLRASNEAINVLIGGLNTDIESAQVAAEATLEHLIRRRRFDDAAQPARNARTLSIQYATLVQQIIDETRRDVRRAGWRDGVPQRLATFREHLTERMHTEERLLSAMQDVRDTAVREDLRAQAALLVDTVDSCFDRHQELHTKVLSAIEVFLAEQDRQVFGRAALISGIDITAEVLEPVMIATGAAASDVLLPFAERLLGLAPGPNATARTPRQLAFGPFVLAMLRPPQERDLLGGDVVEQVWEEPKDDPRSFTSDTWESADAILDALTEPRRLSALLDDAERSCGPDVADLVRLRALIATSPDFDAVRPHAEPVLAAANDGRTFVSDRFAGDDLLVGQLDAAEEDDVPEFHVEDSVLEKA